MSQKFTTLDDLLTVFGFPESIEIVYAKDMPEPYHTLLVHDRHMTVTLEDFWKSPVNVHVIDCHEDGPLYTRKISLSNDTGRSVEYGAVQIDLSCCSDAVRQQIVSRDTPLGRILVDNDVMTRINCRLYFRLTPTPEIMRTYGLDNNEPLYGRFATVEFDSQPAMILIEVMPAELESPAS